MPSRRPPLIHLRAIRARRFSNDHYAKSYLLLFAAFVTAVLLSAPFALPGQSKTGTANNTGTLIYDAKLREFTCWSEGELTDSTRAHSCADTTIWHRVTGGLYFVRGEAISVLVTNATIEDLFALDLHVDDLSEPVTPVSGTIAALPTFLALPPAAPIFPGVGVSFVSGTQPVRASVMYRWVSSAEDKDFKGALKSIILDPLAAKEVTDLLAIDLASAYQVADSAGFRKQMQVLRSDIKALGQPETIDAWVRDASKLSLLVDRATTIRARVQAGNLAAAGKTINDAFLASRAAPIQRAIAEDPRDLAAVASILSAAFRDQPYSRIDGITAVGGKFRSQVPEMQLLLDSVNAELVPVPPTAATLARLKVNLTTLADSSYALRLGADRRAALETLVSGLTTQHDPQTGLYAIQQEWMHVVDDLISKASMFNSAGKEIALGPPYDLYPIGQWFASKTVTVTVKQGQRLPLFDVSGISDATRAAIVSGDTPGAKSTSLAAADFSAVRVLQFPIYDTYHLKLGVGAVYSVVDNTKYQIDKVTTGSGDNAVVQQFIDTTSSRTFTIIPTVNLIYFPSARHGFPWRPRYAGEPRHPFTSDLGIMLGFGATSPNRDLLLGVSWFPRTSPVGLQLALHVALRDQPQDSLDVNVPLTGRVIRLQQKTLTGVSFGVVLTTDFFGNVFAPIFKP